MINLKMWNWTGDVDANGKKTGEAKEYPATGHVTPNADGSVTFVAHVDGATTSGSKYPRSELREIKTDGSLAAWNLSQGGTMTATLRVDAIPNLKDDTVGKAVIGQIHGKDNELIRLYWNNGVINFHNDISGADHKEHEFTFFKLPVIPIGKAFSYKIDARVNALTVEIHLDGNIYLETIPQLDAKWASDSLYFKAGVYLGENVSQGATGYGQVTFTALDYSHVLGQGLGGLPVVVTPPPVVVPPVTYTKEQVISMLQNVVDGFKKDFG